MFTSLAFLIGFPVFCAAYFLAPARYQGLLLLSGGAATCALAGWASVACLVLVVGMGYGFGRRIERERSGKTLAIALVCTSAPLVVLKYTVFAAALGATLLGWVGVHVPPPSFTLPQPVGLSFYTFAVLAYLVDVHWDETRAEQKIDRFALFVSFFPKLVSGPVERAGTFLPQLDEPKRFDYARVTDGLRIMAWGYFRKVVVADRLGVVVDSVFDNPRSLRGLSLVVVALFYLFQVYYDFWAYSDIAVGAARILGFDLTWNFNRPYASRSVSDYWRRWHISLTRCFFDYVFIPFAAYKRHWGKVGVVTGLMATFVVSGLWHGAQWTFIAFGALHGVALSLEHLTTNARKRLKRRIPHRVYEFAAWLATFSFLVCVDVVFRAPTLEAAWEFLRAMFSALPADLAFLVQRRFAVSAVKAIIGGFPVLKIELVIAVVGIGVTELVSFLGEKEPLRDRLVKQPAWVRWPVYYAVATALVFLGAYNTTTRFVYMQF